MVIITPTGNLNAHDADNQIRSKMNAAHFNLVGMNHNKNGKVIIKCRDIMSTNKQREEAVKHLGDAFNITVPKPTQPRIKIVNIYEEFSAYQMFDILINQNTSINLDSELKVMHIAQQGLPLT